MKQKIDIEAQWDLLMTWINEFISSPRKEALISLYEKKASVICTAPASSHTDRHRCMPGGYIDHINRVVGCALELYKTWGKLGANQSNYTIEELVFAALNHDLGKIGSSTAEYYIENDSKWHVEKGQHYKLNADLQFMKVPDRSLFLLQEHNIPVTENEYLAIMLHDGLYSKGNESYYMATSYNYGLRTDLPILLHHADHLATLVEHSLDHPDVVKNVQQEEIKKQTITKKIVEPSKAKEINFDELFSDI